VNVIKTVGTGSYGEVDLVTHKRLGKQLAMKKIDK
jgi:serine/threonine protein kinase